MIGNLILFFVAATLIVIIVAMLRQRGGPDVVREQPSTPADLWSAGQTPAPQAAKVTPPPARDHEAMARDVMAYLRTLEDRGSPGLTAQVMPVFLRDTSARLDALTEAVAQNDGTGAYRIAHTLHGSAATVGAASMVSTCADLIREVRCGAFDRCDHLIAELTRDFEAIRRAAEAIDVRHGNR
jgi:HPt (histidine-containing phosphotransfer) domain-containing protein